MTFNKNDINTIDEAKEYSNYHGGALKPEEKSIFNSNLLKPNGTLDKALLQDTAQLLNDWRKAREKIKKEKMGLSSESHNLLAAILKEQKGETISYQVVNNLDNNQPVDKVITQFEDILFAESDPEFDRKHEKAILEVKDLEDKGKIVDKEIRELEKEYNDSLEKEQTKLETNVAIAVGALKNDLRIPGVGGRKFFELIREYNDLQSRELYKPTTPATANSYGSVIKTGYNGNGKPYTHPIYLCMDFQGQIWTLLKDIDKDKLFDYIFSSACTWNANKKKKFKQVFTRVANLQLKLKNFGDKSMMSEITNEGYKRENTETHRYMSDIFYIMHDLFPKDSNYQDSPFLKVGQKSCLQFKDNKDVNIPYSILWRGEDASIFGKNYSLTSPSILRAPFPCEVKKLTWANGQIPEFFWQVYNNDEAIDFNAYHEVLGPDAASMERIREDPITVYEKKIHGEELTKWSYGSDYLDVNYKNYVENLLKNLKDSSGNSLISADEVNKLRSEWGSVAEEIFSTFRYSTFSTFSRRDKGLTYAQIKDKITDFIDSSIKLITAYSENEIDQLTDPAADSKSVINGWDKWLNITDAKRKKLDEAKAKWGEKWSELAEINSKKAKARTELEAAEKVREDAKKLRVSGLITQFKTIWAKPGKRSYRELLFLRNILGWIKKWEKLKTDATFDVDAELAKLDAAETVNQGKLAKYNNWVKKGSYFTERLEKWKNDDGKFFNNDAVKNYLSGIKDSLESVGRGLDPVEQNELDQLTHYIEHGPTPPEKRILPMDLKAALGVKTNVFRDLTQKWIDYSQNIDFKIKADEIKALADKVNKPGAKIKTPDLVKYCKDTLAKKPELIDDIYDLPRDNANNRDWLDWFFTRDPAVVIHTIALQELKVDSTLKATLLKEMQDYKDDKDQLILLDRNVYGDGQEFSEEGIIKFYAEKLGGQNHAKRKYEQPFQDGSQQPPFWRWNNPGAIFSVLGLLLLLGGSVWAWLKREKIQVWWNQPAEEEGDELDSEEEEW